MFDGCHAPCKNCTNRTVDTARGYTCHSDCAAYLAYRAERFDVYEKRKNAILDPYETADYKRKAHMRYKRRGNRK
jgi:hypothetical protein